MSSSKTSVRKAAPKPVLSHPVLVIDTETSGLVEDEWARVVEVGAVLLDTFGEEVHTYSTLVHANLTGMAQPAMDINGIEPAEVAAARPPEEVASEFLAFIAEVHAAHPDVVMYAWGAGFDEPMLERMGAPLHLNCAMAWALEALGIKGRVRFRLVDAAADLGVPRPKGLHRALTDARLTGRVIVALAERERARENGRAGREESERLLEYVRAGRVAQRAAITGAPPPNPHPSGSAEARAFARGVAQVVEWARADARSRAWRASATELARELGGRLSTGSVRAWVHGGRVGDFELLLEQDTWQLRETRRIAAGTEGVVVFGGALGCVEGAFNAAAAAARIVDVIPSLVLLPVSAAADIALRLGRVHRATLHPDGRPETDAEHTLMLALVAADLADRLGMSLSIERVVEYALVHEFAEVFAGDVDTFGGLTPEALAAKERAEASARGTLARQLSHRLGSRLFAYAEQRALEARWVRYVDKLLPRLTCQLAHGASIHQRGYSLEDLRAAHVRQEAELAAEYPEFADVLTPLFRAAALSAEAAYLVYSEEP